MGREKAMGRKEQAAETRRKLIDTARTLFAQNGFAATSVRELHRTAGLTDGILYHYFPGGKQELFRVIIEEEFEHIVSGTDDRGLDLDGLPLEEALERIYRHWLELLDEHYDIFRIMFCENEVRDVVDAEELNTILSGRKQWFPRLLRERIRAGEIREIDCDFAGDLVFSILFDGLMIRVSNMGGGWLDVPEYRAAAFRALVHSWRAGKDEEKTEAEH